MNHTIATELSAARNRIAELEEEVRELREAMTPAAHPLREALGLPISEELILAHLARGGSYSRQQLLTVLDSEDSYWERNIDSLIKRIRKRIAPLKISAAYGIGYALEGENLRAIRQIMAKDGRVEGRPQELMRAMP